MVWLTPFSIFWVEKKKCCRWKWSLIARNQKNGLLWHWLYNFISTPSSDAGNIYPCNLQIDSKLWLMWLGWYSANMSKLFVAFTAISDTFFFQHPNPLSGTAVRQWDKTYSYYGNRESLASPEDSVLCLMKIVHGRFLWVLNTKHHPVVASKSVWSVVRQCPIGAGPGGSTMWWKGFIFLLGSLEKVRIFLFEKILGLVFRHGESM